MRTLCTVKFTAQGYNYASSCRWDTLARRMYRIQELTTRKSSAQLPERHQAMFIVCKYLVYQFSNAKMNMTIEVIREPNHTILANAENREKTDTE